MKREKREKAQKKSHKKRPMISINGEEIKKVRSMRFWFSLMVFMLFVITGVIAAILFYVLNSVLEFNELYLNTTLLVFAMALSCIIIGAALTATTSKFIFRRISKISEGMREISRGNFKTRVDELDKSKSLTEFGELERSFNQMASELDGIEIFRNDFINNFSHEFKTPIVSIRGFARQLQSDRLDEEQRREYLGIIISESERLSTMSENVLLLSKLENQQIVSEKTEFYLDEQIRNCILLLEKAWGDKNIELDLELDEIKYHFNEEMLSHVWINLFSNAVKFTGEGGRISCRLWRDGSRILFSVTDSGIGMSEETMSRIFEKFYQGDESHASIGNGIGLNIVHRVVTLAGGDVTVESRVGEGSTFTVVLPIY